MPDHPPAPPAPPAPSPPADPTDSALLRLTAHFETHWRALAPHVAEINRVLAISGQEARITIGPRG